MNKLEINKIIKEVKELINDETKSNIYKLATLQYILSYKYGLKEIKMSNDGRFVFENEEEVSLLIRYLCFKVFKDAETDDLLEANNVTKLLLN